MMISSSFNWRPLRPLIGLTVEEEGHLLTVFAVGVGHATNDNKGGAVQVGGTVEVKPDGNVRDCSLPACRCQSLNRVEDRVDVAATVGASSDSQLIWQLNRNLYFGCGWECRWSKPIGFF